MPKVFEINGFIFFFYSQEANEPPHIHIRKAGAEAKFWLSPIRLQENNGFSPSQMRFIKETIQKHHDHFLGAWYEFFN